MQLWGRWGVDVAHYWRHDDARWGDGIITTIRKNFMYVYEYLCG